MDYTVLLLVPDYAADEFGKEIYTSHVVVPMTQELQPQQWAPEALKIARGRAREAYDLNEGDGAPEDFHVLALYSGHLANLNPEA